MTSSRVGTCWRRRMGRWRSRRRAGTRCWSRGGDTRGIATIEGQTVAVQTPDGRFSWFGLTLSAGFGDVGQPDLVRGLTREAGVSPPVAVEGDHGWRRSCGGQSRVDCWCSCSTWSVERRGAGCGRVGGLRMRGIYWQGGTLRFGTTGLTLRSHSGMWPCFIALRGERGASSPKEGLPVSRPDLVVV